MLKFFKREQPKNNSFLIGLSIGVASVSFIGFMMMTVAYLQKTLPNNNCPSAIADNKDAGKKDNPAKNTQPVNPAAKIDLKINDNDHIRGNKNAKITIVEFSDMQCPYCSKFHETMKQIIAAYPNEVRWVYKHFPLGFHPYAQKAAEASECAGEQGKFWEYADKIFANQSSLNDAYISTAAGEIGLDADRFKACLSSGKYADKVKNDLALGQNNGVTGTPSNFINGEPLKGAQPFDAVKSKIENLK